MVPWTLPPKVELALVTKVACVPLFVTMPPPALLPVAALWLARFAINCAPCFRSTMPPLFTVSALLKSKVLVAPLWRFSVPPFTVVVPLTYCWWPKVRLPVSVLVKPALPEKPLVKVAAEVPATWTMPSTAARATTGTSRLEVPPPFTRIAPVPMVSVVGMRPETASMLKPPPFMVSAEMVCEVGTVLVVRAVALKMSVATVLEMSVETEYPAKVWMPNAFVARPVVL